jgi:Uma2 family endonuclease
MPTTVTPLTPTATTTPPPATGWPRPLRWTVAQFHAVNSTGVFAGRRPMLIRGVLLEQGPMNPPHAIALELVIEALRAAFGPGWRTRSQLPLVLGPDTDPFPDVAMIAGDPRAAPRAHPTTAMLVVEVSDTTLTTDMTEKAELYATGGIQEYWVLDLNARQLHVYRAPAPLATNLGAVVYGTHLTLGLADTVSPLAAPSSTIPVADLLP